MKNKLLFFTLIVLAACGGPQVKPIATKTYTVKKQNIRNSLHFTGNIQPLYASTLTCPLDAAIESINVHYGQVINKGDTVMVLNSTELQKQYNDTLSEYLKAKDNFTVAKAKFAGTHDLWNAGLIAKNNYLSEKSSLAATQIALLQASQKLKTMTANMDDPEEKDLSSLNLTQFDKISQFFEKKRNLIHLRAKNAGVLLEAPNAGDAKNTPIAVGAQIKAGQVLGLVGDLTGLKIEIDIPEVDIHKIYVGMPAKVEGVAFNGQSLAGKVVAINAQASSNQTGTLPSFHALVEVRQLTLEQIPWIKVGMSAEITLVANNQHVLMMPIAAVEQRNGEAVVKLRKGNRIQSQVVITGAALADSVLIKSGLKEGDVVLYG